MKEATGGRRSLVSSKQLDDCWKVGGRYPVVKSCKMTASAELGSEEVHELRPKDLILLLRIQSGQPLHGFALPVIADVEGKHGWVDLDSNCIKRVASQDSWQVEARYRVNTPCILRVDKSITSPVLCEVASDQEVLVLDLDVDVNEDESKVALIAQVNIVDTDTIGWLSPEPDPGSRLLDAVNLLGPQVVGVQKHRKSIGENDCPAWEVGCQYRVLEKQSLRSLAFLDSKVVGKVPAGAIVEVLEVVTVQCPDLGECPSVRVNVLNESKRQEGWLRCSAKDGHDLIDSRDQLACEKVLRRTSLQEQNDHSGIQDVIPPTAVPQNLEEDAVKVSEPWHEQIQEVTPVQLERPEHLVASKSPRSDMKDVLRPVDYQQIRADAVIPLEGSEMTGAGIKDDTKVINDFGEPKPGKLDVTFIQEEEFGSCFSCSCQRACTKDRAALT